MLFVIFFVICIAFNILGHPLKKQMVDMSYVYDENMVPNPIFSNFKLKINASDEAGFWLQYEDITTGSHVGTHMDAPSHAIKGGKHIDDLSVNNFIAPASVIDITNRAQDDSDTQFTIRDFLDFEKRTGKSLDGTIILLRTGWGKKWPDAQAYLGIDPENPMAFHFPGIDPKASNWLADNRDVIGVGTDTVSLDTGLTRTFQTHINLLGKGIFLLENVANVEKIPIHGATLHCFPMKLGKASGSPTRVIATFPELPIGQSPFSNRWSFKTWNFPQFSINWPTWE